MERKITYPVTEAEQGLRIEQFLRRRGYSAQNLARIKRMPKNILVNGVFCYLRQPLSAGDTLCVHIQETESSQHIPPVHIPLDINYEDEDLVVINKPAGMPIHPSMNNYTNSLANGLAWYYQQQGKSFIFRCCNRLDRDTSGLTVVAKHLVSASILSAMTKRKEVCREYLAITRGNIHPPSGTINAPLGRREGTIIERMVDWEKGEPAITHYRVLDSRNGHSLVSLRLETGRTHQIRIHMKYLGCPLIGDYLYNPDMEHIRRQALHSHRLSFPHPITGEKMAFEAQMPEDMRRVIYP
ncbi:MAG TPA: RluA family pseudouridine synthase [Candidatus Dorea gallistercoris]|uniref:Pseudouridine synthase n=1 Tax=Candidatus Dorea gallistercoris TaxID=2838542 RepID=A0A9D1R904_9FIRM|nr:RluA family pseudouridine synthase [Candidatus Dorea gallistercoris]